MNKADLIKLCDETYQIKLVDNQFYFLPKGVGIGIFSAEELRAIADELDRRNSEALLDKQEEPTVKSTQVKFQLSRAGFNSFKKWALGNDVTFTSKELPSTYIEVKISDEDLFKFILARVLQC